MASNEEEQQPPTSPETTSDDTETEIETEPAILSKWPGWPGDCVFRVIVPVAKVGSIIGRKGDLIKKMCDDTRARIRVLDGPIGNPDRVVLISGKEEPEADLSPAMDAVIRVFKRVSGLSENEAVAGTGFCSIRMLVASTQAINLIGKQGTLIKSIQESTGSSVRVLATDESPVYASPEERVVELQGEGFKVLKALEAVVGHLRKFLVDHSVLPLFEKTYSAPAPQERQVETWADNKPQLSSLMHTGTQIAGLGSNYSLPVNRESLYLDREIQLESQITSGLSLYGQDPSLPGIRNPGLARAGVPFVTQIAQTMQIPLSYAEDIIGIEGSNIAFIRRSSGAILTVQESRGLPEEITVEIKGTSTQVQMAQQLIQEVMTNHNNKEAIANNTGFGRIDSAIGPSSYSQLTNSSYQSTSLHAQPYGAGTGTGTGGGSAYGNSGAGGFGTFRL